MRGTFPGSHLYFSISHSFYFNWLHELNQYQPNYPSALSFLWCLIQSLLGDSEDEVSLLLSFCFVTNHLLTNWEPESSRFFFFFFYPNIHFSWQLDTVMIWCVIWACLGSCVVSVQAVNTLFEPVDRFRLHTFGSVWSQFVIICSSRASVRPQSATAGLKTMLLFHSITVWHSTHSILKSLRKN